MSKPESMKLAISRYLIGFSSSVVLTLAAFGVVMLHQANNHGWPQHELAMSVIVGLAIVQLVVQLICFLHLNRETRPRWNLIVFLFMILTLVIVVFGSLWIMYNLNYNMHPQEMEEYLRENPGSF